MIDAKEVRIGNIVRVANLTGYIKAMTICEDGDADITMSFSPGYDYDPWAIEPIPLTHEWLERMAFGETCSKGTWAPCECDEGFVNKMQLWLEYWPEKDGYKLITDEWIMVSDIPVKHIHQLQNLYFSLCGEELHIQKDKEHDSSK